MVTDVNSIYRDRFTIYTYSESLFCAPKTNTMLYISYTSTLINYEKAFLVKNKSS